MKTTNISNNKNLFVASLNAVPACQLRDGETDWFPAVDVVETEQEYVFDVDLPGLMPEEIQLEVDSAAISISGNRLPMSQSGRRLRVERPSGAFSRQLPLPPNTTGEIYGSFAEGVLELRVPKAGHGSKTRPTQTVARKTGGGCAMMPPPGDLTLDLRSRDASSTDGILRRPSLI